ncbi:MAG: hypothetical protein AAF805_03345 [Planctomycetota bacterium]
MTQLTEKQRDEATLIASVGCDRETIAAYIGCHAEDLAAECREDERFAAALRRAEAGCELAHMRNIQQAARDERHWRASVWWLERRLPERYARREAGAVSRRELARFLSNVASGIAASVVSEEERRRVIDAIAELHDQLRDPLLLESEEPEPSDDRQRERQP